MMRLFSGKIRLAGTVLLAGIMALAGTAFGQQPIDVIINESEPDLGGSTSGAVAGDLIIIPNYGTADADIDVRLDNDNNTVTVTDDFLSSTADGFAVNLTLGANSSLTVNNGTPNETNMMNGFMARGGTVTMESDSVLTVSGGGDMRLEHNTFTMRDGASINIDGSFSFADGSNVTLGASSITGSGGAIEGDSTLTLADGAEIKVAGDFEIFNGTVTLNNSTINTNGGVQNGDGAGFNIGWYDGDDEEDAIDTGSNAELLVNADRTATLNADGFFSIKQNGVLRLGKDAIANITLYTGGDASDNGIFLLGGNTTPGLATKYPSEFGSFTLDGETVLDSASTPGGYFYLGDGSTANIDGRAVFGAAGDGADSGVHLASGSSLNISGNAYFLDGSKLTLDDTSTVAQVTVGGVATIENGARVVIGSHDIGDVILSADSLANSNVFENLLYTLEIVNNQEVRIADISSEGIVERLGQNSNYVASGPMINNIVSGAAGTQELQDNLKAYMELIGIAIDDNPALAEIAMKQLIGEEALAATSAVQSGLSQGNQALGKHFQALRGDNSPAAGAGDAENRLWIGGFGQWSSQDDEDNIYGYDYNSVGVMLGYDREIAALPGLTLGLNGSWNSGTVENNEGLAETDVDSFGLGVYGLYEFTNGFFLEADLGYGQAKNDSEIKLALGGKKSGDFDIDSFQAGLNLGYDFRFDNGATLTPSAGLRYTHIKQDGWRESIVSNPSNLAVANWFDDSTQNFLEFPINLKLAKSFETQGGAVITPELRVGAVFTANDPESSLRMGFVGSNDSVTIYGIDPGRSRFTAGAGIKAQLNDTVDLFAGYDLEARSNYTGHSASLGLGFSF